MYGYQFKCGACELDVSQAVEPELLIVPINGASESLQCCRTCAKDIKAELAAMDNPLPLKPQTQLFGRDKPPAYVPEERHQAYAQNEPGQTDKLDRLENKIDSMTDALAALVRVLTPKQ